jgi:cytochrome b561
LASRCSSGGSISGWLVHAGRSRGSAGKSYDASCFGLTIFALILLRLVWRINHPVAPESSLPPWQRVSSEAVHWLLSVLVLAATGWLFASFRGWSISSISFHLPMLAAKSAVAIHEIDGWHQIAEWGLLILIGIHVAAALAHIFVFRDRIMQRMLPTRQRPSSARVCPSEARLKFWIMEPVLSSVVLL